MGPALLVGMQHGRSRTSSREESVKRRQLEARRAPLLRVEDRGPHTYSVHRPPGGRDVLSPLPGAPAAAAQSAWAAATRPHTPPAPPIGSGTGAVAAVQAPRARPVVAPIEPLPRRARASEAPPARFPAASSIRIDPARPAARPDAGGEPEPGAYYYDDGVSGTPALAAPLALAEVQARIAARAASSLDVDVAPAGRRIAAGWWVALVLALAFVVIAAMRAG